MLSLAFPSKNTYRHTILSFWLKVSCDPNISLLMSRKAAISYIQPSKRIRPSPFSISSQEHSQSPEIRTAPPLSYPRRLSLRIESDEETSSTRGQFSTPSTPTVAAVAAIGSQNSQIASEFTNKQPKNKQSFQKHKNANNPNRSARMSPLSLRHPPRILETQWISRSTPVLPKLQSPTATTSPQVKVNTATTFAAKYNKGMILDFGAYAKVYRCTRKSDGVPFAVKEAHVFGPYKEQLLHSCDILLNVDHPLLTKVVDYIYDSNDEKVYVISELYEYGSVYSKLKAERRNYSTSYPDERVVWDLSSQLVDALEFLHNPGRNGSGVIVHRDISLKNILVSDIFTKQIIIILSILAVELVGNSKTVQLVGCPTYAAPEVLCGSEYDEKADIWSLGCAIYEICKGYQLFYNENIPDIIKSQYNKPTINLGMYSEDLQNFVKSMIILDPDKRITASEASKHPKIVEARQRLESGVSAGYGWFSE